ncbi:hypothetical protein K469DRAFT_237804 [Zopfia rhizophila CBS 207.26]|uniref:Uncharacterized protein n=1 Tax=Zopfia rhizophila CBS 207.26 TaxID=1314779 RepID=A0A6A6EUF8_9PEZI|nr:hypothetical protein K469DRAFT_237804 [Zopfia rhizophila CBS 207.26]
MDRRETYDRDNQVTRLKKLPLSMSRYATVCMCYEAAKQDRVLLLSPQSCPKVEHIPPRHWMLTECFLNHRYVRVDSVVQHDSVKQGLFRKHALMILTPCSTKLRCSSSSFPAAPPCLFRPPRCSKALIANHAERLILPVRSRSSVQPDTP